MQYPIHEEYPAIYKDEHGVEDTILYNDGRNLRMTVRGVEFTGGSPDFLTVSREESANDLTTFTRNRPGDIAELCGCEIQYKTVIPLKEEYLATKTKRDIFRIWDTMTEYVQETYVCPQFARRIAGTGYRG